MQTTGLLLIMLGGVMEGIFSLPVRITPRWAWENIWGAGSLAALAFIPVPLLLLTIPDPLSVYATAPTSAVVLAVLFGAGWGLGGIFFGLGIRALGLSVGTSMIMGLVAIGGSVIPMLLAHRDQVLSAPGVYLFTGIGIMLLGLIVCSRAGSLNSAKEETQNKVPFAVGLTYCIAAGLLSALVNFALVFGAPITTPAMARGLDASTANNAVWALVFTANYLVNFAYCVYLSRKNRTFHNFFKTATVPYWLLGIAMGLVWAGGIIVYGRGASLEGVYGPVFGFPIMLIVSILTGNLTGAILGEWRGATLKAKGTMAFGVAVMLLAVVTLGRANFLVR
jgi:L-rhamnose-H+ transport protein